MSTALLSFNPGTRIAQTVAGTVYSLSMLAGPDFAARYAWAKWKRRKGVEQERDLTRTVVAAMSPRYELPQVPPDRD